MIKESEAEKSATVPEYNSPPEKEQFWGILIGTWGGEGHNL
jgi:hypothetical protein